MGTLREGDEGGRRRGREEAREGGGKGGRRRGREEAREEGGEGGRRQGREEARDTSEDTPAGYGLHLHANERILA